MDSKGILMNFMYFSVLHIDKVMVLFKFSSYRGFITHLRVSKSVVIFERFEKVSILVSFLLLSLWIHISFLLKFTIISRFSFSKFLLNLNIVRLFKKFDIVTLDSFE